MSKHEEDMKNGKDIKTAAADAASKGVNKRQPSAKPFSALSEELQKFLSEYGFDSVNGISSDKDIAEAKRSPLSIALEFPKEGIPNTHNKALILELIRAGADARAKAERFLEYGDDNKMMREMQATPLHLAILYRYDNEVVKCLIEEGGADVNAIGFIGSETTPLRLAMNNLQIKQKIKSETLERYKQAAEIMGYLLSRPEIILNPQQKPSYLDSFAKIYPELFEKGIPRTLSEKTLKQLEAEMPEQFIAYQILMGARPEDILAFDTLKGGSKISSSSFQDIFIQTKYPGLMVKTILQERREEHDILRKTEIKEETRLSHLLQLHKQKMQQQGVFDQLKKSIQEKSKSDKPKK